MSDDMNLYIKKEDRPRYYYEALWFDPTDNDWSLGFLISTDHGDEVFLEEYQRPYSIANFSRWREVDGK